MQFQTKTAVEWAAPTSRANEWEFLNEKVNVQGRQQVVKLLTTAATAAAAAKQEGSNKRGHLGSTNNNDRDFKKRKETE